MRIKVGIVNYEPYSTRENGPTGLRKNPYKPLHKRFFSSLENRFRGLGLCISDAYVLIVQYIILIPLKGHDLEVVSSIIHFSCNPMSRGIMLKYS